MLPKYLVGKEKEQAKKRQGELEAIQQKAKEFIQTLSDLKGGYVKAQAVGYKGIKESTISFSYVPTKRNMTPEDLEDIARAITKKISQCRPVARISISQKMTFKCFIGERRNALPVVHRDTIEPYRVSPRNVPEKYRRVLMRKSERNVSREQPPLQKNLSIEDKHSLFELKIAFKEEVVAFVVSRGYASGYAVPDLHAWDQNFFTFNRTDDMDLERFLQMKSLLADTYYAKSGMHLDIISVELLKRK